MSTIFPRTYSKLASLLDVALTGATAGQVLTFDAVSATWVNALPSVNASALTGLVPVANLGSGFPTASTYLRGDGSWATISAPAIPTIDAVLAAGSTSPHALSVGALTATSYTGSGSGLNSVPATSLTGLVPVARLGSGTASSSTYLRGDGSWVALANPTIDAVLAEGTTTTRSINVGNLSALAGAFTVANDEGTNVVAVNLASNNESALLFNGNDGSAGFAFGYDGNGDNWYVSDNVSRQFLAINRDSGSISTTGGNTLDDGGGNATFGGITSNGFLSSPYNTVDDGSGDASFQGYLSAYAGVTVIGQLEINDGTGWNAGAATLSVASLSGIAADYAGEVDIAAGGAGFTDPSPGDQYDLKCGGDAGGITCIGAINANGGYLVNNATVINDDGNHVLTAPNGTHFKLAVSNSGTLSATAI